MRKENKENCYNFFELILSNKKLRLVLVLIYIKGQSETVKCPKSQ